MSRETIAEKSKETSTFSTEVRQDLKITSDKLNNLTKLRVFNLRMADPQVKADLDNQEAAIQSCYTEARRKGILTKVGSDMLNEYSMRNGMLSVHKSEYTASRLNITRSPEEIETVAATKGLVVDLKQLRDNMFSLDQAEKNLSDNISDDTSSSQQKKSLVDDYSNFSEHMPDYGVGGGDE